MSTFKNFKSELQKNFEELIKRHDVLFVTDVEKDAIWNTYLNSYPEDEKQGHNCNSCRQFLKPYANIVVIGADYKLKSIWDFKADGEYAAVAENLNKLVTSAPIKGVFVTKVAKLGTDFNHQQLDNGEIIKWEHFHFVLPSKFVDRSSKSEESIMGDYVGHKDVFKRSLNELTQDSVETVLELIAQNSLYRGIESKEILEIFLKHKKAYMKLSAAEKDNYAWANSVKASGAVTKIRNNSIGTLLVNLSEGKDLDFAVTAFEKVMCPANYKRPNAMEVLGDNKIIQKVFQGYPLKIHSTDDEIAILIKNHIIDAYNEAIKYAIDYNARYAIYWEDYTKWHQRGCKHGFQDEKRPKFVYWSISDTENLVELKVNHYRQKYWYWKKLIE